MYNYILTIIIVLFTVSLISCANVETDNSKMREKSRTDFVMGCLNSGEFDENICKCVFYDLDENYKHNFALDGNKFIKNTEENNIFNIKIIESFEKCNAF